MKLNFQSRGSHLTSKAIDIALTLFGTAMCLSILHAPLWAQPAQLGANEFEACDNVARPGHLIEFLASFRTIVSEQYAVKPGFYTEANLKRCFGGALVTFHDWGRDQRLSGYVSGFDMQLTRAPTTDRFANEPTLRFDWTSNQNQSVDALVRVIFSTKIDIRLEDIERIFGKDWKRMAPIIMPHGVNRMEEFTIQYEYQTLSIIQILGFSFKANGSLAHLWLEARLGQNG